MRHLCFCILFIVTAFFAGAQSHEKIAQLEKKYHQTKDDSLKIAALDELADYYYIFGANAKGDSVVQKQLVIAEHSTNKNLLLTTLFGKSFSDIYDWSTVQRFDHVMRFIEKGLDYARETERNDYAAAAYIRKASIYRFQAKFNEAIQEVMLAFSALGNTKNDSLKATMFLELADIYTQNKNAVAAYKNINNAFELAYGLDNLYLQSKIYHYLAKFYRYSIGDKDLAKKNLMKSLEINKKRKSREGQWKDYLDLALLTDEKAYYDSAFWYAKSDKEILESKETMFLYYMTVDTNFLALKYLHTNNDLKQKYQNLGASSYYYAIGNIYLYDQKGRYPPDSAIHYYKLAEEEILKGYDKKKQLNMFLYLGDAYSYANNTNKAIEYYEKALDYAKSFDDIGLLTSISKTLGEFYAKIGDTGKAYEYTKAHLSYNETLVKLTKNRQVILLELQKEEAKQRKDAEVLAAKLESKQNLQYMGITIAVTALFFGTLLLGMFPISRFTIRALCFFVFICIFEFIIVMIDNYLHHKFHGDTLKIWLTKIVLIAMILPLHHYVEHLAVHFMESKRMVKLRSMLSIKNLWAQKNKLIEKINHGHNHHTEHLHKEEGHEVSTPQRKELINELLTFASNENLGSKEKDLVK